MPSYDAEKDKIVSYRVDRMRNVEMASEWTDHHMPFHAADYCRKVLWMFDGDIEEQEVILIRRAFVICGDQRRRIRAARIRAAPRRISRIHCQRGEESPVLGSL